MGVMDDAPRLEPETLEGWSAWLRHHHADAPGVWLVSRKAAASPAFDYDSAVREALRWGWVDSTRRSVDARRSMMWYAPRRPRSVWTRNNKERVAELEAAGLMEPAGASAVAAARESGMWTLMDDVEDLVVPADLDAALALHPGARQHWEAFPPSSRKEALAWIALARQPATRARRVRGVAEASARGERPRR